MMKNEKLQLLTQLASLEQDLLIREQQLESEQIRIKDLQYNVHMLDEYNSELRWIDKLCL
jgi:hypothetical protein